MPILVLARNEAELLREGKASFTGEPLKPGAGHFRLGHGTGAPMHLTNITSSNQRIRRFRISTGRRCRSLNISTSWRSNSAILSALLSVAESADTILRARWLTR